jgi:hypothetical protein
MILMRRARLPLVGIGAVLLIYVVCVPVTSAAIKFEWKVGGVPLGAGETRGFTTARDGVVDLHGTVAGAGILMLSTKGRVETGAEIIGGKPGTSEEILVLENVTVDNPGKCAVESEGSPVGTIRTNSLKAEIVESQETHEPLILVSPRGGSVFVSLLFLNRSATEACAFAGVLGNVTGSYLVQPLPALTEVLRGAGDEEAPTKNYILSNGTLGKAGLNFAGNAVTLTGLALEVLNTDERAGIF